MDFENIEARLENWSRIVRSPRFQSGECAFWAKLYCAMRDRELVGESPAMTKDERDGWLVEKAWSMLPNHTYKNVLKYHYIWRMSPTQIRTRMQKTHNIKIGGIKFELILAKAHTSLFRNIASLTAESVLENVSKNSCTFKKDEIQCFTD